MLYAGEVAGPKTDMLVSLDPSGARLGRAGLQAVTRPHDGDEAMRYRFIDELAKWDLDSHKSCRGQNPPSSSVVIQVSSFH